MEEKLDFRTLTRCFKKLVILNLVFLMLMSVFRVVCFLSFSGFNNINGLYFDAFKAFLLGMRFDLSTIAYINTLVTLSFSIVFILNRKKYYLKWLNYLGYYYWVMFCVVILVTVVDFGYFSYFKDHINVMIYGFFEDDTIALVKTVLQNHLFPYALLIVVLLSVFVFYLCRKTTKTIDVAGMEPGMEIKIWKKVLLIFVLVCVNTLVARGSLKMFPLSVIYSEISPNAFINKLSVNGLYALGDAIKAHKENGVNDYVYLKKQNHTGAIESYFGVENIANIDIISKLIYKTKKSDVIEKVQPNVVLIVMESFGGNLLRYDSKEFDLLGELRNHFEADYVFKKFLPAGLITIHAIETMVLNIVQRPNNLAVTQTKFSYREFISSAATPYKKSGYKTVFIYGGSLKWRHLDTFLPFQGFDELVGESCFPQGTEKNQWGVYDQYLYDEAYKRLENTGDKPVFVMIMTTTNHPPYSVPASYKHSSLVVPENLKRVMTKDEKLAMKRFITYQYANQKAGEFVSKIKNTQLKEKTIVALTGDHNFWDVFNYNDSELFYRYSVPFYIYVPTALKPEHVDTSVTGSHVDIMPTLYNLSLSEKEYISMGHNLFSKNLKNKAVTSEGLIMSDYGITLHNTSGSSDKYFQWDKSSPGMLYVSGSKDLSDILYYNGAMTVAESIIKKSFESKNIPIHSTIFQKNLDKSK